MGKRKDANSMMISDEAYSAIDQIAAKFQVRITKKDLLERLLFWMRDQSDVVQGTILGTLPPSHRADIARMELEKLAKSGPKS